MGKVRSGDDLRAYRASYNYRAEYFKRNPGLFGCVWFCSQCYKPLFGRKNVVIDHIIPLSRGGRNHVSNCTAICKTCNLKKSDKVDGRIVKGQVFKLFESGFSGTSRGAGAAVALGAGATMGVARGATLAGKGILGGVFKAGWAVLSNTVKLVTYPIRKGKLGAKLLFIVLYVLIILFVLINYTDLLNAWM